MPHACAARYAAASIRFSSSSAVRGNNLEDKQLLQKLKSILSKNADTHPSNAAPESALITRLKMILVGNDRQEPHTSDQSMVMYELAKQGKFNEAFDVCEKMSTVPDIVALNAFRQPDSISMFQNRRLFERRPEEHNEELAPHVGMIKTLCKAGKFDEAYRGSMAMLKQGLDLDPRVFNTLVYGLYKSQHVAQCVGLVKEKHNVLQDDLSVRQGGICAGFDSLLKHGICPDVVDYTTLIEGLCKAGQLQEAYILFKSSSSANSDLRDMLFRAMLQKGGENFNLAVELADTMFTKGKGLDAATVKTLIEGLIEEGNLELAVTFYDKLTELKVPFKLGLTSYNALLNGLFKMGREGDVVKLFKHMVRSNLVPDANTVDVLVNGLCEAGKVQAAVKIMELMNLNSGDFTGTYDYESAVRCFMKSGRHTEAVEVLSKMVVKDIHPSQDVYRMVIDGLCEVKEFKLAGDVIKQIKKVNSSLYRPYVVSLFKAGNVREALQWWEGMFKSSKQLSFELLECFLEAGLMDEACEYYREAKGKKWDSAHGIVEIVCEMRGDKVMEFACKLVEESGTGVVGIVGELMGSGRVDLAAELLAGICENGKLGLYDLVVMEMCKVGRFQDAAHILEYLFGKGILRKHNVA